MKINKTYTLRFVKLPPATIVLGKPFDIIFSLTDDLGLEIPGYPDTEVAFYVESLDEGVGGYRVEDTLSKSNTTIIGSDRSLLHKRTLSLHAASQSRPANLEKAFLVLKLAEQAQRVDLPILDSSDIALMKFANVTALIHLEDEGISALVVPTHAGPFDVIASKSKDHSRERVTTTEVHLTCGHLVRIVERPLDKIIGDHLWHGSVILANLILENRLAHGDADNIVELGAGCGLVSLAVREALKGRWKRIIATDLDEVVETTLRETLHANDKAASAIHVQALEWSNAEDITRLLDACQGRDSLWLVAADVLYNSGSHDVLLQTLEDLCKAFKRHTVTIAYRPRASGDDAFFGLASSKGLAFELVFHLADVQIWQYSNK
ncbi:hypothetical protein P389DRAFT_112031 [Cystobasidium minutum MCA 4210]|uniref:uncharacterized protein n=1 Tax=Cystobasidium minutum MCA 4210 TaxID=1397322 RepID=UPI0034CF67A8|eukprot:jgi/Rhomi1/112031/CE112030_173